MKKIFIILFLITLTITPALAAKKEKDTAPVQTIYYLNIQWWEKYNDNYLTDNLKKLYDRNYDLKNAALRVEENEKMVKMQFANELPSLGLSGELSRTLQSSMQQYGSMRIPSYAQYHYYLPITMGYEIDIWGKNRLKTKSAKQQLEIIKQAQRATYISLTSSFAADYFNLIKTDEFLSLQNELIKTQEAIVEKTQDKYSTGLCSINELLAEQRMLTTLREERNRHLKTQETLIESLRVYLSDSQAEIARNDYEKVNLLEGIPQKYSTAVIENRPDFLQEEANIKRIGFDVKVARREFLPNFIIFGQIGLNAYHLDTLFNSVSQLFNAGILPSIDLFSGGRKIALLKLRKYEYQEALNSYQKTILESIRDLNSGLVEYKTAMDNYEECKNRLALQDKTYSLLKDKNTIGSASELDVLYAKEAYLMVKKEEVSDKINSIISTISLYKAAGGVDLYKINDENL